MAEGDGKASISSLDCSICLEEFKTPKLLPCHHTFCAACLEKYIEKNRRGNKFDCPLCRKTIDVPRKGVEEFQTNFYIEPRKSGEKEEPIPCDACTSKSTADHRCLDCEENFCSRCTEAHMNMKVSRHHKLLELKTAGIEVRRKIKSRVFCTKHPNEEIKVVCKECDLLLCLLCMVTEHQGHKSREVSEEAKDVREKLARAINDQEINIKENSSDEENIIHENTVLRKSLENEKQKARNHGEKIKQAIDLAVKKIEEDLTKNYEKRIKENDADIKDLESHRISSTSLISTATQVLDLGTDIDVAQRGNVLCTDLNKNTRKEQSSSRWQIRMDSSSTLFTAGKIDVESLQKMMGRVGEMKAKQLVSTAIFPIKDRLKKVSTIQLPGKGYVHSIAPIGPKNDRAWMSFGPSVIEIVGIDGKSHLSVDVGTRCHNVVLDGNGNCIVSCPLDKSIKRVTPSGHIENIISNTDGQPFGVAYRKTKAGNEEVFFTCVYTLTGGGAVYVAPYHANAKVKTLSTDFSYSSSISCNLLTSQICVADNGKNNVTLLNDNGQILKMYEFKYAYGATFDKQGCILVSPDRDSSFHRLKPDGTLLEVLDYVTGIRSAVDSDGRIWVGRRGLVDIYEIK